MAKFSGGAFINLSRVSPASNAPYRKNSANNERQEKELSNHLLDHLIVLRAVVL